MQLIDRLGVACEKGNVAYIKDEIKKGLPINTRICNGASLLIGAIVNQKKEMANYLLSIGVDPNISTIYDLNALGFAVDDMPMFVEELIKRGTNISLQAKDGLTILMRASKSGNTKNVRLLLEAGAKVKEEDFEGRTALYYARSEDILEILLQYGASINDFFQTGQYMQLKTDRQKVEFIAKHEHQLTTENKEKWKKLRLQSLFA